MVIRWVVISGLGGSILVSRATKFRSSSAATHADDILPLLKGSERQAWYCISKYIIGLYNCNWSGRDLHFVGK